MTLGDKDDPDEVPVLKALQHALGTQLVSSPQKDFVTHRAHWEPLENTLKAAGGDKQLCPRSCSHIRVGS